MMMKDTGTLFVFLRHGESTGNAEKRHQGQADFPLTERGKRQAEKLAKYWLDKGITFDKAISSPLIRAKETAEILIKHLKIDLVFDPLWMERDNGQLAGLLHDEAKIVHPPPDFIHIYEPIADTGESLWELYLRAGTALNKLVKNPPGQYLVITHGGLLNMLMHALIGVTPQPNFQGPHFRTSNTGYTTVRYLPENNNWVILEHNNTCHLKQKD